LGAYTRPSESGCPGCGGRASGGPACLELAPDRDPPLSDSTERGFSVQEVSLSALILQRGIRRDAERGPGGSKPEDSPSS
jgi:hypothetical protein